MEKEKRHSCEIRCILANKQFLISLVRINVFILLDIYLDALWSLVCFPVLLPQSVQSDVMYFPQQTNLGVLLGCPYRGAQVKANMVHRKIYVISATHLSGELAFRE